MPKRKTNIIIIMLIIIILLLLFLFWLITKMGRIGYSYVSTVPISTIRVTEDNYDFGEIVDLNIFSNPEFENKKMVAPMSKGSYQFVITNTINNDIKYSIETEEVNDLGINMKYRLLLNNVYVIGNSNTYVDIDELNLSDVITMANSSDLYTIEWIWEEADNDTDIGKQVYAEYKLKIKVQSD